MIYSFQNNPLYTNHFWLHIRHNTLHNHDSHMHGLDSCPKNSYESDYSDPENEEDSQVIKKEWIRHEESKPPMEEQIVIINLGDSENPKETKIGTGLSQTDVDRLIELLKEYQDVFAWSYADMPGLDPNIVEHTLPLDPAILPKKQKLRRTKPELSKKIEEEVMKLLKVDFIEVTHYADWIANVVPVMKKDGRVRVCVDYRDLNKEVPKMISHYHILTSWSIAQQDSNYFPSWMVSLVITKSE